MKHFLHLALLLSSPLAMNASGDTLKTEPVKRWNITASVGYGFPFAKQVIGSEATVDRHSTIAGELKRGTFGKGVFSFVSAGYKINSHFGAEFGIHSTWGKKIMVGQFTNLYYSFISQTFFQATTNGMFAGFFMTDSYGKFHISFHNDLLIGVMNQAIEESFSNDVPDPVLKYTGGVSYGWLSRLGSAYDISGKISVGLNAFFLMHSWSPVERNTLNGQNKFTFSDNTLTNGISPLPSDQLPRVTFPLHVAGINAFITYNF
jgi:hypothetical protein